MGWWRECYFVSQLYLHLFVVGQQMFLSVRKNEILVSMFLSFPTKVLVVSKILFNFFYMF